MGLVCLSHFTQVYLDRPDQATPAHVPYLYALGMISSPTFVALSGIVLGLLFTVDRPAFAALRGKLVDRALFLLTIAHALIACSRLTYQPHAIDALRMTFMTDTIAICVLVGVSLIGSTPQRLRVSLGFACFAVTWWLAYAWTPLGTTGQLAKELVVGAAQYRLAAYAVPVLPWFGVYIMSTALGEYIGQSYRRRDSGAVERVLFGAGLVVTALGVAVRYLGWYILAHLEMKPEARSFWELLFSPWSKLLPSPVYVMFFGGLGLLLMAAVAFASHRSRLAWLTARAATVGRCSLAVFTVQFYVYFAVLAKFRAGPTELWPLIFIATLGLVFAFALWWDVHDYNRLLTVGLSGVPRAPRLGGIPRVYVRQRHHG